MVACLFAFQVRLMFESFVSNCSWEPCRSCSSVPNKAYKNFGVLVRWRTHRESRNQDNFSEVENKQHLGWEALLIFTVVLYSQYLGL